MEQPQSQFENLLLEFLKQSHRIDEQTTWSETEPEWWLMMSTMRRQAYDYLQALKNK